MISDSFTQRGVRAERRGLTLPLGAHWHRAALLLILALSAVLNFVGLSSEGYDNEFYAAAVRSMSENWHNFFFNSFDPGGFVTIDKPPLGFWFQVASVKLFGFSGFALLLPEALAGVLAVLFLYFLVSRTFGRVAGLVAALALAVTPISVVTSRNNTIDSILVLFVLAGVWALFRAAETRSLRWLLLSAAFIGLGFNVKMLEAYLVVPALGLAYLLGTHLSLRRRIVNLAAATAVLLAVSLSWVTIVDLTPASQRPWIDSTSTNSALDLAIGYNGLQRLTGNHTVSGAGNGGGAGAQSSQLHVLAGGSAGSGSTSAAAGSGSGAPSISGGSGSNGGRGFGGPGGPGGNGGGPGGVGENGPTGALRLLDTQLGSQIGWFLPLAVIGLVVGLWQSGLRRRLLDDRQRALVLWGTWLIVAGAFFSVALFFHTYYLTMLAPAVAALAGIAVAVLWGAYQRAGSRTWWTLPLALLLTAAMQVYILAAYPSWERWLAPLVIAACIIAAIVLTVLRLRPQSWLRLAVPATSLAVLGLVTPAGAFAAYTMQHTPTGSIVRAGPSASGTDNPGGFGGPPGGFSNQGSSGSGAFGPGSNGNQGMQGPPPGAGNGNGNPPGPPPSGAGFGNPPAGAGNGSGSSAGSNAAPGAPGGGNGAAGQTGAQGSTSGATAGNSNRNLRSLLSGHTFGGGGMGGPGGVSNALISYLEEHRGNTKFLVATTSSNDAAPIIIKTGLPVMSMGGFTGDDPILTPSKLAKLVQEGEVKYFLLGGRGGGPGGGSSSVTSWIESHCSVVPASKYGSTASSAGGDFGGGQTLYVCGSAK